MEREKLKILSINDSCTACGACISVCKQEALTLKPDKQTGFYYPILDEEKCVNCRQCENVCHVLNDLTEHSEEKLPFMLKANDLELVRKSSSGGAFSLLAENVLAEGGVVFGAAYDYVKERLVEISTDENSLDELRKSKYVESYTGKLCKEIENQLRNGRKVLFCGTPCQVKGIRNYLIKKKCPTEDLLLVHFLCHGVPSNKFFTDYKHWLERKHHSKISRIDFRSKTHGWRSNNFCYYYGNGYKDIDVSTSYYYVAFNKNLLLRESCYGCDIYKQGCADLTVADFWGIFRYDPQNRDNDGLSLLIAHNAKARKYIEAIDNRATLTPLPLTAIDYIHNAPQGKNEMKEASERLMQQVKKDGYMPTVIKTFKKQVRKAIIKDRMRIILKSTGIWKIIKK